MSRSRHGKRYYRQLGEDHLLYYTWWQKEPKWWRKLMKHRKRRAEWRRCDSRIKKGYDPEDMTYPLDKKPWEYYW